MQINLAGLTVDHLNGFQVVIRQIGDIIDGGAGHAVFAGAGLLISLYGIVGRIIQMILAPVESGITQMGGNPDGLYWTPFYILLLFGGMKVGHFLCKFVKHLWFELLHRFVIIRVILEILIGLLLSLAGLVTYYVVISL